MHASNKHRHSQNAAASASQAHDGANQNAQ
jgi:hypothetical protein